MTKLQTGFSCWILATWFVYFFPIGSSFTLRETFMSTVDLTAFYFVLRYITGIRE